MSYFKSRVAILGASKGLGLSLTKEILFNSNSQLWISSRKIEELKHNPVFNKELQKIKMFPMDFTKPEAINLIVNSLKEFKPNQIIYCAGGGPYGNFHQKPWHSHLWTFNLNLLFPTQLLHHILSEKNSSFVDLNQIIFIGSSVAENKADPGAASYSAAKHGLKGLIQSLIEEFKSTPPIDLRLYSPHYMNTDLLPKNAKPRQNFSALDEPCVIAKDLLLWASQPADVNSWHRIIPTKQN